jgi:hypothetical protein
MFATPMVTREEFLIPLAVIAALVGDYTCKERIQ